MKLRIIQNTLMAVVLALTVTMMLERWQEYNTDNQLFILQREMEESTKKTSTRLEGKIDRVGYLSDSYHINTSSKIKMLEQGIEDLQLRVESIEEQLQSIKNNKT